MRIAIVLSGPLATSGACRVAVSWARVLHEAGHDVALVYESGDSPLALPSIRLQPSLAEGPTSRFRRVGARGRAAARVLARLGADRLDLVITHDPVLTTLVRRTLPEVPLLQTFHSSFVDENQLNNWKYADPGRRLTYPATRILVQWIEQRALAAADAAHTLSHETWRRLCARHPRLCAGTPWRRIPGAVGAAFHADPIDRDAARRRLGLPADDVLLLSVRRLIPRNAVERIFSCARQLGGRARFIVVGSGALEAPLRRRLARLGLEDRVWMRGFVPDHELPTWYRAADAFLLPTRDLECFGMPVVEALAGGCLPLVTPVGGPQELVPSSELVASANTGTAFAALVKRYLDGKLGRYGRQGLAEFARRRFSEEAIRPAVLALVEQVRRRPPAARRMGRAAR